MKSLVVVQILIIILFQEPAAVSVHICPLHHEPATGNPLDRCRRWRSSWRGRRRACAGGPGRHRRRQKRRPSRQRLESELRLRPRVWVSCRPRLRP